MLSTMALTRTMSTVANTCLTAGAIPALRLTSSLFNHVQTEQVLTLRTHSSDASISKKDRRIISNEGCTTSLAAPSLYDVLSITRSLSPKHVSFITDVIRCRGFSTDASKPDPADAPGKPQAADTSDGSAQEAATVLTVEEYKAVVEEKEKLIAELQEKAQSNADKLLRALAEMENLRQRTARELDSTQKYAAQKFAKSILEVADTLERAYEAVPEPVRQGQAADLTLERATLLLKGVVDGVQMTSSVLLQVLKQHGIEQYNPVNEKFDPNLHNALFEVPDPSKEVGTVAVVTKRGYRMYDRVVRPAEVGVVRAAE